MCVTLAIVVCMFGCGDSKAPKKPETRYVLSFYSAAGDPAGTPALLASGVLQLPTSWVDGEEARGIWAPTGQLSDELRHRLMDPSEDGYPFVAIARKQEIYFCFNPGVVDANVEVKIETKGQDQERGEWFWTTYAGPERMGTATLTKQEAPDR